MRIVLRKISRDNFVLVARQSTCKHQIEFLLLDEFIYQSLDTYFVDLDFETFAVEVRLILLREVEPHCPFLHLTENLESIPEVLFELFVSQVRLNHFLVQIKASDDFNCDFELVVLHQDVYYDMRSHELQTVIDETMRETRERFLRNLSLHSFVEIPAVFDCLNQVFW